MHLTGGGSHPTPAMTGERRRNGSGDQKWLEYLKYLNSTQTGEGYNTFSVLLLELESCPLEQFPALF